MNFELRNVPLRQVRNDLKVPGVIYGHGIDSTPVMVDDRELRKALSQYGTSMTFAIQLDGKEHLVYFKDVQTDPLHNYAPVHFDLMKVTADDTITISIPLNFLHREQVQRAGEVLSFNVTEVEADAQVGKGVSSIDVDLMVLREQDVIQIKDIQVPEGITLLQDPEQLVANFTTVADFSETEEEEEDVSVITETEEEDTEEE
jgi:large subunit ribosomal protein L25